MSYKWITVIDEVLDGIDQQETDSLKGWWETTDGAKFGADKKAELIARLKEVIGDV